MQDDMRVLLHPARAEQLMMLAEKWRCNSSEAVERLIRDSIAQGNLPDTTPGLEVAAFGNLVAFKIDFDRTPPMSWQQAMKISHALGQLVNGKNDGFRAAYSAETSLIFTRTDDGFAISFTSPDNRKTVTVTTSILDDLSRQFNAAAMKAQANKTGRPGKLPSADQSAEMRA
ncbi:hypothetical protein [Oricola indica]|jgi:hypothetical protein|uniref:hypothetical protein n=1 Tax=Oricola indica TaxID=2872591 RepID=UPI001CBD25B5|nr:hypothetical protein [Oricola indica]